MRRSARRLPFNLGLKWEDGYGRCARACGFFWWHNGSGLGSTEGVTFWPWPLAVGVADSKGSNCLKFYTLFFNMKSIWPINKALKNLSLRPFRRVLFGRRFYKVSKASPVSLA